MYSVVGTNLYRGETRGEGDAALTAEIAGVLLCVIVLSLLVVSC